LRLYTIFFILKLHDLYRFELAKLMHKFHIEMLTNSPEDLF